MGLIMCKMFLLFPIALLPLSLSSAHEPSDKHLPSFKEWLGNQEMIKNKC
jgi:hypothetical protein